MANRYWVGGAAVINGSAAQWSATSGGAGGASFPGTSDVALFDANSGSGIITFSSTFLILSGLDCRGFTGSFTCDASAAGISIRRTGNIYLRSTLNNTLAPGFTLGFSPTEVNASHQLDVDSATYWPIDFIAGTSNANCSISLTGGTLYCRRIIIQSPTTGFQNTFNTNNNDVIALIDHTNPYVFGIDLQANVAGNMGTSRLSAQNIRIGTNTPTTTNATLRIKKYLLTSNFFVCKNLELDPVSGTDCTIESRITVIKLTNINKNVPFRLILAVVAGGNYLSVTDFDVSGSPSAIIDIRSSASTNYGALIKNGGGSVSNVDYLRFWFMTGSPNTNTWYVGANSSNTGGVPTGLIFANNPAAIVASLSNPLFFASL